MNRARRLLACAALLVCGATWAVASPTAWAQEGTPVIELNLETVTGEPLVGGVAVFDFLARTEYRIDGVPLGEPVEIVGVAGVTSEFQLRRTDLQPSAIACEGARSAEVVTRPGGNTLRITPGEDRVVCTVTLRDDLPVTGLSAELAALGAILLGAGALAAGVSRSTGD